MISIHPKYFKLLKSNIWTYDPRAVSGRLYLFLQDSYLNIRKIKYDRWICIF